MKVNSYNFIKIRKTKQNKQANPRYLRKFQCWDGASRRQTRQTSRSYQISRNKQYTSPRYDSIHSPVKLGFSGKYAHKQELGWFLSLFLCYLNSPLELRSQQLNLSAWSQIWFQELHKVKRKRSLFYNLLQYCSWKGVYVGCTTNPWVNSRHEHII